ncbi:polyhydroxyalkanoate synthesis repressor PhaR [Meridianimarinicoccus aquatilis]|uniref:Polyhydroxyalkanoate synthesis repressor PhaR n=1 Tax=Meridianimarinicoccus aquatilis TaxID=2552766 RepID=A0A4R6B0P1_9RHOB|nr:polyhydroxyalkanoate synthesis repressor PhaR [Fluviibacterium aquatile]QIE41995.1 polyhydroxyalkanoate synthesis repressor PhaR [Rhodobacteraceae bacterium SC52]TDL90691.1 polyhydroxyalkanoate synthesis repressor PhaR [Fluviibacterium aquatile]
MSDTEKPLLIKRYASRRLYNTETSDYVTLEDIAKFIRAGRELKIVDLKSGDDLTRQYLLQIVAEHESKGESVLPISVLTDLVRSYTTQAQSVVPQFLAMSFDMLRDSQSKMMENFTTLPTPMNPMNPMSGIEAMKRQQKAFLATLVPGWKDDQGATSEPEQPVKAELSPDEKQELDDIRAQLAELKDKMSKLGE